MLNAKTLAGVVAALLCSGLSVVTQAGSPVSDTQTPAPTTATPVPSTKSRCSIEIVDEHKITVDCPTTDRVRIIGVGDWGEEFIAPYVLGVRDGVTALANTGDYDFIFAVGDNFYRNGVTTTTDELWKSIWVDRWAIGTNLTLPWVAFLGNHDWNGNTQATFDIAPAARTVDVTYYVLDNQGTNIETHRFERKY